MMLTWMFFLWQTLQPMTAEQPVLPTAFSANEELLYEVSWMHIKIGTLRMQLFPMVRKNGVSRYRAKVTIDSYPEVPFVSLHSISYSEIDSAGNSLASYSFEKKWELWEKMLYEYHPEQNRIVVVKSMVSAPGAVQEKVHIVDTLDACRFPVQDGISLVYFTRLLSAQAVSVTKPTVSIGKIGETDFYRERKKTTVELDAWPHPVRTVEIHGLLRLEGIFGLSGEYTGWFSDDAAAVPIIAKLKVMIGNIRIELKQWRRSTWQPPTGKE
jgi:hypothetical protein